MLKRPPQRRRKVPAMLSLSERIKTVYTDRECPPLPAHGDSTTRSVSRLNRSVCSFSQVLAGSSRKQVVSSLKISQPRSSRGIDTMRSVLVWTNRLHSGTNARAPKSFTRLCCQRSRFSCDRKWAKGSRWSKRCFRGLATIV